MRNFLLLTSVLSLGAVFQVSADYSFLHPHTPIELKPVSLENSYQTASVCFLGLGCGDEAQFKVTDDNLTIDTAELCKQKGFGLTSCPLPAYPFELCPDNPLYFAQCKENRSRACDEAGYVNSCAPGEVLDVSQACPYDNSYQKCICNPCEGYSYSYAEATSEGYEADGSCVSCSAIKYRRKVNDCAGFKACDCGGEIGTEECLSGTEKRFATCKECYVACPSGTIDVTNYWCGGGAKCYVGTVK